jgi:hypothetical protein
VNAVEDQTTPTPAAERSLYAVWLVLVFAWSRMTRTLTPACSRAIRSLIAVVSFSSYMVMSSDVVAELMKLSMTGSLVPRLNTNAEYGSAAWG